MCKTTHETKWNKSKICSKQTDMQSDKIVFSDLQI